MSRLRILLATVYPRQVVRGGVEAAAAQLVGALERRDDVEVHVAALHHAISRPHTVREGGVYLHWLPRARRLSTLQMLTGSAAQLAILERRIRPDVLHAQGATPLGISARSSR